MLERNWVFLCFYSVGCLIYMQGLRWFDGAQGFILRYARGVRAGERYGGAFPCCIISFLWNYAGAFVFFPLRGV